MRVTASLRLTGLPGQFSAMLALMVCVLEGCATNPVVDWDNRVGNFTFEQTIAELGPPDTQTKVNGKIAAVWVLRRPGGSKRSGYEADHGSDAGMGKSHSGAGGRSNRVLRLTFDAEGRLAACSKNF